MPPAQYDGIEPTDDFDQSGPGRRMHGRLRGAHRIMGDDTALLHQNLACGGPALPVCASAWGSDADREAKSLKSLIRVGSLRRADSHPGLEYGWRKGLALRHQTPGALPDVGHGSIACKTASSP
jgi:hypothetical protein